MVESPQQAARRLTQPQLAQGYEPEALHEHTDANGQPLFWRIRLRHPDGRKYIRPMHKQQNTYAMGEPPFKSKKPLYLLHTLDNLVDEPVFVVEGEFCADRLAKTGLTVTTSGSAQSAKNADWKPLQNTEVILWPDNDEAGLRYAREAQCELNLLGCRTKVIDIDQLALPVKGDCIDWLTLNPTTTQDDILQLPTIESPPDKYPSHLPTDKTEQRTLSPILPEAIPNALPVVNGYQKGMLPAAIEDYIQDIAERQRSPVEFAAINAVCGLAGAIGNKARIRPKQNDDWEVTPNQWGLIIGRPSTMKSPSMKATLGPLKEIEKQLNEKYELENQEYKILKQFRELEEKKAKKDAEKQFLKGEKEQAMHELSIFQDETEPPQRGRLIVNDTTLEKLGELLSENEHGLIVVRDEISGFIAKLNGEDGQTDRAFYLECYEGSGSFVWDRIGRGTVSIDHCTLSMIGGIQPSKIAPLIRGGMKGTSDDGFIQRFQLAVWPDSSDWKYTDAQPDSFAKQRFEQAFRALFDFTPQDQAYRFSKQAQKHWVNWYTEINLLARAEDLCASLESHMLKMPKTIAGLALLFQLIEDPTAKEVGEHPTLMALEWADFLLSHARRIYSTVANQCFTNARLIISRKSKLNNPFTERELQRKGWAGLTTKESVSDALSCLVDYKHLIIQESFPRENGGRPTRAYSWNTTTGGESNG